MTATGVKMQGAKTADQADVVLGEDWIGEAASAESEARAKRDRRGVIAMNRSPLARKLITFNLLAILVLVVGILFLNPYRDGLMYQREQALGTEARLISEYISSPSQQGVDTNRLNEILGAMSFQTSADVFIFDPEGNLLAKKDAQPLAAFRTTDERSTLITDFLDRIWTTISMVIPQGRQSDSPTSKQDLILSLLPEAVENGTQFLTTTDSSGKSIFTVATPLQHNNTVQGIVGMSSNAGEIDALVRAEREQVLQMFVIAILVSVGLSLVLASTIANPLSDLAAAAEIGRERNARKFSPARVRIPDLTARPDEIGRLSSALRGMVAALYDRIDANEQFAADVAHEIKNPLASLRSAVASLRMAQRGDHRTKLLDVIEHDTRRLDRLVSDISNASRLDSELVKEEEDAFDLLKMIGNLAEYLGNEAQDKGVEFITDMPSEPIVIEGLESRLAQVFVNLLTNAISFCDKGDAIRVWVRKRENRVLVVVEDTGPGIPEQALTKIFNRFYTERPVSHFGNNSGLGLAISKQIVEAHGGVIWAENIRPAESDESTEPLGRGLSSAFRFKAIH